MKNFIKSKKGIFLCVIILLAFASVIFARLIFWKSDYSSPEYKFSAQLFSKVVKAQSEGSTVELTKNEINQIIALYFKEYRKGNLVVKSVEGDIQGKTFAFYVPVTYGKFNIFMNSRGSMSLNNGKLKYTPEYFKAGKITLPKSYILKKLSSKVKDEVDIEGDSIIVNIKEFLPQVKAVAVKDGKLFVTMEKKEFKIEDMLKGKLSSIRNLIKNSSDVKESGSYTKNNSGSGVSKSDENNTGKNDEVKNNTSESSLVSSEKQKSLDNVISGLNSASSSVSTSAQKAVISKMISVAGNMKDSSYNPYSEESSVKAAYGQLSQAEKAELKAALFSNVDSSEVDILEGMIGGGKTN
ncbi:DUF2140 domain-containing protein [Clostridium sp.]|uniref:DUF2140 domain-containing protein n=1 Tax=Clostridium sp. TaxID=1506 RepID=UPI002FDD9B3E